MIKIESFKGEQAVVLENDELRVVILPALGAKLALIYRKDKKFELLFQNKNTIYDKPQLYSSFEKYDTSGFDDAFPAINEGIVTHAAEFIRYPDHGEIWSATFDYEIKESNVLMTYKSKILPYDYSKTVSIEEDKVILHYSISNTGNNDISCLWAMHCLICCEEDMEILFPSGTVEVVNVQKSEYLGDVGKIHSFPETKDTQGVQYMLDRVQSPSKVKSEKYYVNGIVEEGFCGAYYPSKGILYSVSFDKQKLPYLGFWITEGEFKGDYNCALEPSNGFYDSIETAQRNDSLYILKKGCRLEFDITLKLEIR